MPSPVLVNSRSPIPVQAERMGEIDRQLARIDRQVSTGERFAEPAEDPSGANRAAMLARLDARLEAEKRSLERAGTRLALAETAIASASDALLRARELALAAANGTLAPEDRAVIAREVEVLAAQLLDSANSRDESGRSIFGGSRSRGAAYAADAGGVVQWQGFATAAGAEAAGIDTAAPPRGPDLFGDAASGAFAQLAALSAALAEPESEAREASLAGAIDGLEAGFNRLVAGRAAVGAGRARLENEIARVEAARLDTAEALSAVRGVDLTAAFAELNALKLSLSAAQGSFARVYEGSLFDRLG